jgi:excisionase family DNA binding protein
VDESRDLLRPADLASKLGVSRARIYQLISAGVLPAVRCGGAIRIPIAAWERWLADQRDRALATVRSAADGHPGQ